MAIGGPRTPVHETPGEPEVLANIEATSEQRRAARLLVLLLLAILVGTWPIATVRLPQIDAFVPSLAAALFVSDSVTAVLLFGQFVILQRAEILALANGYLFSALIVIAHALAFPGAFSSGFLFGAGLQSAIWLYWFWHAGLPVAIIFYVLLRKRRTPTRVRRTQVAIAASVTATFVLVAGLFWFMTQHHDLLPLTFIDIHPISYFRRIIGGVVVLVLGGLALGLLLADRRSLLDEWLIVALSALLIEIALASVLSGDRYTISWYAGRFYQLVTATVVMAMLLAETTTLYARLARTNTLLQRERVLMERAVQARQREREARLVTGDAVAATISHEVKQPLAAIATRAGVGLRWLDRQHPDIEKAKTQLLQITLDAHRGSAILESVRQNFRQNLPQRSRLNINDVITEVVELTRELLHEHHVSLELETEPHLPPVQADRIQLQQVLLNLITNAVDVMQTQQTPRILRVRSDLRDDGDLEFSITDSGPGILLEPDRIFDPLFTTKRNGMGMGLFICRSIIEAHDGRLWVAPSLNKGACFQFTLRAATDAVSLSMLETAEREPLSPPRNPDR